jgi:hypothetical protein
MCCRLGPIEANIKKHVDPLMLVTALNTKIDITKLQK